MTALSGDRSPHAHCAFPPAAFYHNGQGGCVLDVTQAPFGAKGDGRTDDTEALRKAMTFVREHRQPIGKNGFTTCSPKVDRNWLIYLPDGEYLVTDTVSQSWPALAMNVLQDWNHIRYLSVESPEEELELYHQKHSDDPFLHGTPGLMALDNNNGLFNRGQYNDAIVYDEVSWNIRIFGESREGTVIRLKDGLPGFRTGAVKPVLSFSLLERGSNINLGNILENVTIHAGRNNPDAAALMWSSSNWGGVRNVRLVSDDGQGKAGLWLTRNNATGYCRDVLVEGFETGIELAAGRETMMVLEYSTIRNCSKCGLSVGNARSGGGGDVFNGRRLLLQNLPLAVEGGRISQVVICESFLEQVTVPWSLGENAWLVWQACRNEAGAMPDYCSHRAHGMLKTDGRFPAAKDSPAEPLEYSPETWASVEDYGAVGDGRTDDTQAIQKAMESGKPVVCFTRSNYVINGVVRIPAAVREIIGLFAGFQRAVLKDGHQADIVHGQFVVEEESSQPLLIHQMIFAGGVLLDHEAMRPVVMEDILVWFNHCRFDATEEDMLFPSAVPLDVPYWRLYRNTTPKGPCKELYLTDCLEFAGDDGSDECTVENVRVWGRCLDTEHVPGALFSFRNSAAWIFGFKGENSQTLLKAGGGSAIRLIGGTFLNFVKYEAPLVVLDDSQVSCSFLFWHWQLAPSEILAQCLNGQRRVLQKSAFRPNPGRADSAVVAIDFE